MGMRGSEFRCCMECSNCLIFLIEFLRKKKKDFFYLLLNVFDAPVILCVRTLIRLQSS